MQQYAYDRDSRKTYTRTTYETTSCPLALHCYKSSDQYHYLDFNFPVLVQIRDSCTGFERLHSGCVRFKTCRPTIILAKQQRSIILLKTHSKKFFSSSPQVCEPQCSIPFRWQPSLLSQTLLPRRRALLPKSTAVNAEHHQAAV